MSVYAEAPCVEDMRIGNVRGSVEEHAFEDANSFVLVLAAVVRTAGQVAAVGQAVVDALSVAVALALAAVVVAAVADPALAVPALVAKCLDQKLDMTMVENDE
ncbi:hypothetical protein POM88_019678 [Heracleum sosnowskyi]|uniref:Uncharacterized protein n=1 Tax=Heracleum sosnowskyi TaxID=360622 RepID=A0AAD8ICM0_9APIA|nr:hypothetical protein POM88_019678 [Heracleum sosnowskyi]